MRSLADEPMQTPAWFSWLTGRFRWFFPVLLSVLAFFLFNMLGLEVGNIAQTGTDENLFRDDKGRVVVIAVFKNGASDRAGMKVGDVLVSINGKTFRNSQEADRILKSNPPGTVMEYGVLRNGIPMTLYVKAVSFGIPIQLVAVSITFVLCLMVGLFVIYQAPAHLGAVLFSGGFILLSFSISAAFTLNTPLPGQWSIVLLFTGLPMLVHAELWMVPDKKFKRVHRINYLIGISLSVISMILFSFQSVDLTVRILFVAVVISYIVFNSVLSATAMDKFTSRMMAVAWSLFGLVLTFIFLAGGPFGAPVFFALFLTAAVPLTYAILIVRGRVFGIDRILRRNIQYYLLMTVIVIGLIIGFYTLAHLVTNVELNGMSFRWSPTTLEIRFDPQPRPGFSERPFFILGGVVIFLVVWWAGKLIRGQMARWFFKDEINYNQAFNDFSARITGQLQVDRLASIVTEDYVNVLRVKSACLYILRGDLLQLAAKSGQSADIPAGMLSPNDLLVGREPIRHPVAPVQVAGGRQWFPSSVHLLVPLIVKDRLIGLAALGEKRSEAWLNAADIEFAESLGRTAAVAIENARLTEETIQGEQLRRELDLARDIQQALLPDHVPVVPGLDVAGFYLPASTVGGDYYDFLRPVPENDSLIGLLGDVAGKGVSAGLIMTRLQGILSASVSLPGLSLKDLFCQANRLSFTDNRKSFITLAALQYKPSTGQIEACRAGHLPILRWKASDQTIHRYIPSGLALGMAGSDRFEELLETLSEPAEPGDYWVLVSDGITDAAPLNGPEFGLQGVESVLHREATRQLSASDLCLRIIGALSSHCEGHPPGDDCTMVVFRIGPSPQI
ncbi:MAG: SpoIIE family protein phosphatase [Bacteroidetes bacterium]|nr:SpoIIE family protein phosphatase [Bacteroidota bacterium]